jgi:hypothetical protein
MGERFGQAFLGEDRARSGVTPSIEVKRPEVADAIDPETLTGNDDDAVAAPRQPQGNDKPNVTPPDANAPKQATPEDTQLKGLWNCCAISLPRTSARHKLNRRYYKPKQT